MRVSLLSSFDGDGQPVLFRGQRTGRVGSICAGRVIQLVEIECEGPGLSQSITGQTCMQETCGPIRSCLARSVAQDNKELVLFTTFNHRLKEVDFVLEKKF